MKSRTVYATVLATLAAGAATTGAVAAAQKPAQAPAPVAAPAEATRTPAPAPPRSRPKGESRRKQVARRRAAVRREEAARRRHERRPKATRSAFPASMDPDRNPNYQRDLNEWVDCMNERGLRTVATMTGVTAGGWTYGTPRTARERHLLSLAGWDEARAIELACQNQAFD